MQEEGSKQGKGGDPLKASAGAAAASGPLVIDEEDDNDVPKYVDVPLAVPPVLESSPKKRHSVDLKGGLIFRRGSKEGG